MHSRYEIWPVYAILQNDFFLKKFYEKYGLETSSRPFLIFKREGGECEGEGEGQHADLDKF